MEAAQYVQLSHERAVLACWYHYTMTGLDWAKTSKQAQAGASNAVWTYLRRQ